MRFLQILASTAPLLGAVTVLAAAGESSATTRVAGCVEVYERHAGQDCGSSDSYAISVRNRCEQAIDAKLCIERSDHTWTCGTSSEMSGGATTNLVSCDSTRKTWLWAQPAHGAEKAPDPGK